jgi:cytochrome P450
MCIMLSSKKKRLTRSPLGAANRDPLVYENPDVFARLETTIAFRMLAERMPGLQRIGPVQRRNATLIRGPLHLPVSAGQAPAGSPAEGRDSGPSKVSRLSSDQVR